MAENPASSPPQTQKPPIQPPAGSDQMLPAAPLASNSPNPNLPSTPILSPPSMDQNSQISSSPRLTQSQPQQLQSLSQQQPSTPSQQQLQQIQQQMQQQQQQQMQRAGSASMPRISQIQQQFGAAAAASAMRQHTGLYGGQMNFGGAQLQQQQQQKLGNGLMSRVGMMGPAASGQLSMVSGQAAASAQFNLQSQMLGTSRPEAGMVQGSQFLPATSSGQTLSGMQTVGTTGSLALNSQIRMQSPLSFTPQRLNQGQIRQQQMSQQSLSSPQKIPGQGMTRTSSLASINPQLLGLTQNGQTTMMPSSLSQQQWLKQKMAMTGPGSYQLQQQQQRALIQQQLQKSMGLTPQHISQLVQQQQSQINSQQQQQLHVKQSTLLQQQQHLMLQQQQQPQQSPRMSGAASQKSMSLTGSQPDTPASGTTTPGGSSSQGTEGSNQLLGKRKIQDLVAQVDPYRAMDPEVESILLEIADDFINSVTTYACALSKHRKSPILESKDLLLHLEKNWQLSIPGYTKEEQRFKRKTIVGDIHKKRIELIRSIMESSQLEMETSNAKNTVRQNVQDPTIDRTIKPSMSSEQLNAPSAGSPMLQRVQRF